MPEGGNEGRVGTLVGAFRSLAFLYDVVTYPVYFALQQPWRKVQESNKTKAKQIHKADSEVMFRRPPGPIANPIESCDTMEQAFRKSVEKYKERPFLGTREILEEKDEVQSNGRVFQKFVLGEYSWLTFADMDAKTEAFGRGLREIGQEPKCNIVIFAETRAEWLVAAYGCMKHNIPVVTIYATLGEDAIAHGINQTEVTHVITSAELLPKFKTILHHTPKVKHLVYMESPLKKQPELAGFKDGIQLHAFEAVLEAGERSTIPPVPPKPEDVAIIMYTSGSTGVPKGVLLSHTNLTAALYGFATVMDLAPNDVYMGFLPLAHVLELLAESVMMICGCSIGYSTPLTITDTSSKVMTGCKGDASVLRPTLIAAVPLILDRIYKSITDKVEKGSATTKALFRFACNYKSEWAKHGWDTPLLNRLVFRKVREILGGRVRGIACGGAPLSPETHDFIRTCLCCPVIQGYGLTETSACATLMAWGENSTGLVGGPLPCCDIRMVNWEEGNYRITDKPNPRGEVIIGGANVSQGYYKMPEKTKEDFFHAEGKQWFRTGDIGEMTPDGCLRVIDRKKDLVKLQFGEYVSLGKVETELKTCPIVDNVCVYGDSRHMFTVALVVPNPDKLKDIAVAVGVSPEKSFEELCLEKKIEDAVLKEIQNHGKKSRLERFEVPQAMKLCSEIWSPDMGLVTAAFKLRRKPIQDRYQDDINRMYGAS